METLLPSRYGSPVPIVIDRFTDDADLHGGEALDALGRATAALGVTRVWLVTDAGLRATPWVDVAVALLWSAGITVQVYADVVSDPSDEDVARAADAARTYGPDGVVAIGGGSVLDTAKGAALLLANGGRVEDWWGFGKAPNPVLPLVAVPTTAGTGSEAQSFAVIRRASDGQKMACGSTTLRPRLVVLDRRLTLSAPRLTTVHAGLDAIGHAVEAAVCTARTPQVTAEAIQTFSNLAGHLHTLLDRPDDLDAREGALYSAFDAGLCVEASMLGAAHACANALSAKLGVPHGAAVGLMLPRVLRHNAADPAAADVYAELTFMLRHLGVATDLIPFLESLLDRGGVPRSLAAWGVTPTMVPELAAFAARQWTGTFNPVQPVDYEGLLTP